MTNGTKKIKARKVKYLPFMLLFLAAMSLVMLYVTQCKQPTPEKTRASHLMILAQIESMGNLQVVKYNIQDIVEYEKVRAFLPNSKTVLMISGEVSGYIDLTKIEEKDIVTMGDSVSILLPEPEVGLARIDHAKSKVYDVRYGLWEKAELIDAAYAEAERKLNEEASRMGILSDCENGADRVLRPILNALGFTKVSIRFKGTNLENKSSASDNLTIKKIDQLK